MSFRKIEDGIALACAAGAYGVRVAGQAFIVARVRAQLPSAAFEGPGQLDAVTPVLMRYMLPFVGLQIGLVVVLLVVARLTRSKAVIARGFLLGAAATFLLLWCCAFFRSYPPFVWPLPFFLTIAAIAFHFAKRPRERFISMELAVLCALITFVLAPAAL